MLNLCPRICSRFTYFILQDQYFIYMKLVMGKSNLRIQLTKTDVAIRLAFRLQNVRCIVYNLVGTCSTTVYIVQPCVVLNIHMHIKLKNLLYLL